MPRANSFRHEIPAYVLCATLGVLLFLSQLRDAGPPAADGLDASYTAVLAWALTKGMVWGRDLVFTYGPLGFLPQNHAYNAELYSAYLIGQAFLGAVISMSLVQAVFNLRGASRWIFALAIVLWLPWLGADALWQLFLGTSAVNLAVQATRQSPNRLLLVGMVMLYATGAAVLGLIKFTVFPVALLWLAVVAAVFLIQKKASFSLLLGGTFALAFVALWLIAKQPLGALPDYLRTSIALVSGYGPAMSFDPPFRTDLLGFSILATTGGWLAWQALIHRRDVSRALLFFFLGCVLFFTWRAAFTRADEHIRIFFPVACFLPLAALALLDHRYGRPELLGNALALLLTASLAIVLVPEKISTALWTQPFKGLGDNAKVLTDVSAHRKKHEALLAAARAEHALPRISATVRSDTVDMLSWHQGALLLNQLNYHPRPVFQGYTVYTETLLRLNEGFLLGSNAPKWLIARMEPLDGRLPMTDDSLAMLAVLRRYDPVLEEDGYALARRRDVAMPAIPVPSPATYGKARLGDWIAVPEVSADAMLTSIDVKPSLLGKLRAFWFRSPPLTIELRLADGKEQAFRLVPAIAKSGFLLSPFIRNNNDWLNWYTNTFERKVTHLRVTPTRAGDGRMFKNSFRIAFSPLPIARPAKGDTPYELSDFGAAGFRTAPASREGTIERINVDGQPALFMVPPSALRFTLQPGDYEVEGSFGLRDDALSAPECAAGDGIRLAVYARSASGRTLLHKQDIDPFKNPFQRGSNDIDAPTMTIAPGSDMELAIETGPPGSNGNCDWGYVRNFIIREGKASHPRSLRTLPWGVPRFTEVSASAVQLPAGGNCVLDAINGTKPIGAVIRASGSLGFAGWMSDAAGNVPGQALLMLEADHVSYVVALNGGGLRPDVAVALKRPALARSGFDLSIPFAGVAPGTYRLAIVHARPGRPTRCPLDAGVAVLPGL